ncbi:Lrp/AsnC family transcription regulator [Natrialba magadii ATCC 43099]|uniref:AsnC family transcriptional regulator n=1 Tax=Natrialba magadii (strain ATCC 43099 / DSM 3394 / CCM 3739 / CIP 104546 / IAM 13178 / JCM 8861 / NBRC 102185 / NCIMB 2190 / MS3) TaxID=547559 RepID=D3SUW1_NATMM|nr:winged helix-turn-helix transcriptional regulator [Natrialba magadii]ADD05369.1 Lrp/AsnC family transcription regulator [Natrialba magadii ATCC 43099]ELY29314.1 AsnC family transcriptional regulator [Natrialba magadii ATCC 43099]
MSSYQLDEVDKAIIHFLQKDARNNTTTEIAAEVDVSASTVGNRINQLEDEGVIEGYNPNLNYEQAQLPLHIMFVCSAPVAKQTQLAEEALDVFGVVNVREMLSGTRNIRVETISREFDEIERSVQELDALGLEIETSEIIKQEYTRPFDHFGSDLLED